MIKLSFSILLLKKVLCAKKIFECLLLTLPRQIEARVASWQRELSCDALEERWSIICYRSTRISFAKHKSFRLLLLNRALYIYRKNRFGFVHFVNRKMLNVFYTSPTVQSIWSFILDKLGCQQMPNKDVILNDKCPVKLIKILVAVKYKIFTCINLAQTLIAVTIWDSVKKLAPN